jgi:hypothetical protein
VSLESDVEKLQKDMYFGDGKNNPPVVTRLSDLEGDMIAIRRDWFGNGTPGLRDTLIKFMADSDARDDERKNLLETQQEAVKTALDKHNSKVNLRLGVLGTLIAVVMLILAWLTYVETNKDIKNGTLKVPRITQSEPQQQNARTNTLPERAD